MWKATVGTFFRYCILHLKILLFDAVPLLCFFLLFAFNRLCPSAIAESEILSTVDGKQIYLQLCAHCHGKQGTPSEEIKKILSPPPADLTSREYKYGDTADEVANSIRQGIGSNMLRFKERLSEEQIQAVASFVISFKPVEEKESTKSTRKRITEDE